MRDGLFGEMANIRKMGRFRKCAEIQKGSYPLIVWALSKKSFFHKYCRRN